MPGHPRRLADLKAGVRLLEVATGTVWEIERVRRANSYSTPWVHLVAAGPEVDPGTRRVEGAGALLGDAGPGWLIASEPWGSGARRARGAP